MQRGGGSGARRLRGTAPYLRRELGWPLNELGRIRLHKGDIAGAEEAFWPLIVPDGIPNRLSRWCVWPKATWPPRLPPYQTPSNVPLRVPSKEPPPNTHLQRAPLLEAQVEIEIAAGDIGRAFGRRRAGAHSRPLREQGLGASAARRGRVRLAEGDAAGAEQPLSEAVGLWNEVGAPYERRWHGPPRRGPAASGSDHRAGLERPARTILDGIEAAPSVTPPVS